MKKTVAERWCWVVSHIGLPLVIMACVWMCISFIMAYPVYYLELWNYMRLAVANVFCIAIYLLYILLCVVCMIKLLKRHANWQVYLNIQLFLLPLIPFIASAYNQYFLSYINSPYALSTSLSVWVLLYVVEFCVFCLPTMLVLKKYSLVSDDADTLFCAQCGAPMLDEACFCHVCGHKKR